MKEMGCITCRALTTDHWPLTTGFYGLEFTPHHRNHRERAERGPRHARCDQLCLHRSQPARLGHNRRQAGVHSGRAWVHSAHPRCLRRPRRRRHIALRSDQPSSIFDGVRVQNRPADRGDPPQRARDSVLRARDSEFSPAHGGNRDHHAQVCRRRFRHARRAFSIRARPRPACA